MDTDVLVLPQVTHDEIRLVIIEDEAPIARGLERLKDRLERKLQDVKVDVETFGSKEEFDRLVQIDNLENTYFCIDINLGPTRERDGIKILESLKDKASNCIIFTASDKPSNRAICKKYGIVDEDSFISKGVLDEDLNNIVAVLLKKIKRNRKLNLTTSQSKSDVELAPVDSIQQDLLNFMVMPKISITEHLNIKYFSVQSDLVEYFGREGASINATIAICKHLLNTTRSGYNFYGLFDEVFEMDMLKLKSREGAITIIDGKDDFDKESLDNASLFISMGINPNTLNTERLYWKRSEDHDFTEINLSKREQFAETIDEFITQRETYPTFIRILAELFISERLITFYYTKNETGKRFLLLQAIKLKSGIGRFNFATSIWELVTYNDTRDTAATVLQLQPLTKALGIDIQKIFYCKITAEEEIDGARLFHTKVFSLENVSEVFPKTFDYDFLAKEGLTQVNACFKLILFFKSATEDDPSGRTYFIEPMHSSNYKKDKY